MDRHVSRGVKNKNSTDIAIEMLSRGVHNKRTSMDREAIEYTETSLMDQEAIETKSQKPRWFEIAITTIKKRNSKGLIDSLAVKRYRDCLKTVFQN